MDNTGTESQPMTTSELVHQQIETIPIFHMSEHDDDVVNAGKQVLRKMFEPLLVTIAQRNQSSLSSLLSPEDIIQSYLTIPDIQVPEVLVQELEGFHTKSEQTTEARDWLQEASVISDDPESHAIYKLNRKAVSFLSPDERTELTKISF